MITGWRKSHMSLLKKLVLVAAPIAIGMAVPSVASAQNFQGDFAKPAGAPSGCPSGYSTSAGGMNARQNTRPNMCYASNSNPPQVFLRSSLSEACPPGMRQDNAGSRWCTAQAALTYNPESEAHGANLRKPRPNMRCPTGWTSTENRMECWTNLSNAPRARLSNGQPCAAGELNDWGYWCTSNYQQLTFREAENAGVADSNIVWTMHQDVDGSIFSPQAKPFFEARDPSRRAATPAAPAAPTGASGTGSLNPQRRNQVASLCPEGWFGGLAGTARPDPNMCYPGPGALPAYPPQREGEQCAPGHVVSSTWCVNVSGAAGAQAATQPGQTAPNCPPASTGTAAQAGATLGGLLGARRGNGQAGAAIGGLLGQAASGARPAGC
jgi:hypothetical protein